MKRLKRSVIGSAMLAAALLSGGARAKARDVAVVVGVNRYPQLKDADLRGCVNDAATMRNVLGEYGFKVHYLTDPTKKEILGAIDTAAAQKPERFVFYFAGHGTTLTKGDGAILPSDANASNEYSLISSPELYQAVTRVPTSSRSVILDSCYSGAMVRARNLLQGTARYYDFGSTRYSKDLVVRAQANKVVRPNQQVDTKVSGQATQPLKEVGLTVVPSTPEDAPKVCYFVAADKDQVSLESTIQGKSHGYFTYNLANYLKGQPVLWGDANSYVKGRLQRIRQSPMLTDYYVGQPIFSQVVAAPQTPSPVQELKPTAWAVFNDSINDSSKLRLKVVPDKAVFEVNEGLKLEAQVMQSGYLLLLEQGTSGRYNVLYPESMNADDARIAGNATIPGEGFEFAPDQPGFENIRAVLFTNKNTLQKILDAIKVSADNDAKTSVPPANFTRLQTALENMPAERDFMKVKSGGYLYTASLTITIADPKNVLATNFTSAPTEKPHPAQP